jgi:hypothetical protein
MIRNIQKKFLPIASAVVLFFSSFYSVLADTGAENPSGGIQGLENPIRFSTLAAFVQKILEIVTTIGIPIVAIFIIYSGFLFVKAQGNPDELKTAKSTFLWTVVGAAILLASWILAKAICETVVQLGNTSTQCS